MSPPVLLGAQKTEASWSVARRACSAFPASSLVRRIKVRAFRLLSSQLLPLNIRPRPGEQVIPLRPARFGRFNAEPILENEVRRLRLLPFVGGYFSDASPYCVTCIAHKDNHAGIGDPWTHESLIE